MNSITYILFISFLLIQATKIVTAKPLHVNLSPPVTTNENEKLTQLGPHKALLKKRRREFHLQADLSHLEPHLKRVKRGRKEFHGHP